MIPLRNEYVIELPQLSELVNLDNIKNYKSGEEKHWNNITYAWKLNTSHLDNFNDIDNIFNHKDVIQKEYWYQIQAKYKSLIPHIDDFRSTALIFPLQENLDIYWFESGIMSSKLDSSQDINEKIVYKYTYRCPTIFNTGLPHGTLGKKTERHTVAISLTIKNYSWKNLTNILAV